MSTTIWHQSQFHQDIADAVNDILVLDLDGSPISTIQASDIAALIEELQLHSKDVVDTSRLITALLSPDSTLTMTTPSYGMVLMIVNTFVRFLSEYKQAARALQLGADSSLAAAADSDTTPIDGMDDDQVANFLLVVLREKQGMRPALHKFAKGLSRKELWTVLEEANRRHEARDGMLLHGKRPRSVGGAFMVVANEALHAKMKAPSAAAARPRELPTLRTYQAEVLDHMSAGTPRNWIVVAPTGSGKTAMFIEWTRRLLMAGPKARVVVLTPAVALAKQQADAFVAAGFADKGWPVQCFTGGGGSKQLTVAKWPMVMHKISVVVATAQSFLNILEAPGGASLSDIALLVLDECHHTLKDHPYNKIMTLYKRAPAAPCQVLGFTASPAASSTLLGTERNVAELKDNLLAEVIVVQEEDVAVRQVVPEPVEYEMHVGRRPVDGDIWNCLLETDIAAAKLLAESLMEPSVAVKAGALAVTATNADLVKLTSEVPQLMLVAELSKNLKYLVEYTEARGVPTELYGCAMFVQLLRRAMDLVEDAGYEAALQSLPDKIVAILQENGPPPAARRGRRAADAAGDAAAAGGAVPSYDSD